MIHIKAEIRPRLGISSCLLGENVRYDGGNKRNEFIIAEISPLFELIPICPEVAIGMGIPRPPIQLVDCDGEIRARGIAAPASDMTQALTDYAGHLQQTLASLSGYIFKRNSPSCGSREVKVLTGSVYELRGQGIFARAIIQAFPDLPLIDEQQLSDRVLCERFLMNVNKYYQLNFR